MDPEIICKKVGDNWSQEEDDQLNKLYNTDMLDIVEISKIHNRAPGGIISRLLKHQYINNRISARGYISYKNSDLYKEIVSSGEGRKRGRKKKEEDIQVDNVYSSTDVPEYNHITAGRDVTTHFSPESKNDIKPKIKLYKSDYLGLKEEIQEMRTEVNDLKHSIKELVDMMKAIYEFEDI
jgi:hypothetical protein